MTLDIAAEPIPTHEIKSFIEKEIANARADEAERCIIHCETASEEGYKKAKTECAERINIITEIFSKYLTTEELQHINSVLK